MIGEVMTISRLRMATDGKGVATLVTFYNCPLKCKYCLNDYCHKEKDVSYKTYQATYTPRELWEVLRKDEIYYLMTGGGVVFGGGEPLLQSVYIHELCSIIDSGWAKRIETSLNVSWDYVEPLLKDIDEWIIDIKDMNSEIYEKYTGVNNVHLRKNLLRLRKAVPPERLHIRIPNIPCFNTSEDVKKSVAWVRENLNVEPEVFDYLVYRSEAMNDYREKLYGKPGMYI